MSFSVTVKRTVALTHGPRARSGSGSSGKKHSWGCEPTCTIADCSVTVLAQGPLEPPFGRTFTPDCTLQRACEPLNIHHSEYPTLESHSFLERVCCSDTRGLAVASYWSGSCWRSKRRSSSIHGPKDKHGPTCKDPIRYYKNSAHYTTLKRLSLLLTNPHW